MKRYFFTEEEKKEFHRDAQERACFICEIASGEASFPVYMVYEDDVVVAFLDKYPTLYGRTLVAPREHRVDVTGDYTLKEYLAIHQRVHMIAEAIRIELDAERIYLMTFGSKQGNAHVHWHIAPLPVGVPYEQQQLFAVSWQNGNFELTDGENLDLCERIQKRIVMMKG